MSYTRIFEKPYEDGYKDKPFETTPVTASTLNDKDDALEHIEDYLETAIVANPVLEGTEDSLTSIGIEGTNYKIEGGGGGGGIESDIIASDYDAETTYNAGQYCFYNDTIWRCKVTSTGETPEEGEFWTEVQVMTEVFQYGNNRKSQLVDKIVAKGGESSTSESWDDVIDDIDTIPSGGASVYTDFSNKVTPTIIPNYYIETTGVLTPYAGWYATDWIDVHEFDYIVMYMNSGTGQTSYNYNVTYNSSQQKISNFVITTNAIVIVDVANAYYLRCSNSSAGITPNVYLYGHYTTPKHITPNRIEQLYISASREGYATYKTKVSAGKYICVLVSGALNAPTPATISSSGTEIFSHTSQLTNSRYCFIKEFELDEDGWIQCDGGFSTGGYLTTRRYILKVDFDLGENVSEAIGYENNYPATHTVTTAESKIFACVLNTIDGVVTDISSTQEITEKHNFGNCSFAYDENSGEDYTLSATQVVESWSTNVYLAFSIL